MSVASDLCNLKPRNSAILVFVTTTVQFSSGPELTWDGADRQLTAAIRNNPRARDLAPILAGSLDVLRETGAPDDDLTKFLRSIVNQCDLTPEAMVSVHPLYAPGEAGSTELTKAEIFTRYDVEEYPGVMPESINRQLVELNASRRNDPLAVAMADGEYPDDHPYREGDADGNPQPKNWTLPPAPDLAKLVSEQMTAIKDSFRTPDPLIVEPADVRADAAFERGWMKGKVERDQLVRLLARAILALDAMNATLKQIAGKAEETYIDETEQIRKAFER
jgi:hypothetical protein